jgi:hypothetical protein
MMSPSTLGMLYVKCAGKATSRLSRGWILLPLSAVAYVVFAFAASLFSNLGMLGGLLVGLLSLVLLTLYYGWLQAVTAGERLSLESARNFDGDLFSGILNVAFFLFPASISIQLLSINPEGAGIAACASLALVVLCNPIPELIYRERTTGLEAIVASFRFVQEHWIEWFLPVLILGAPLFLFDLSQALLILSNSDQFMPMHRIMFAVGIHFGGTQFFGVLLAVVICNWFMCFRAELFDALSTRSGRAHDFSARAG